MVRWEDDWINDIWRHGSSDRDFEYRQHNKQGKQKENKTMFNVGDRVRLSNGKNTLIVENVYGSQINARYEKNGQLIRKSTSYFVKVDEETQEKGFTMKGKLFQTKEDEPRFGIGLAVNSKGEYVLEMKGTGALESFKKNDVEVVMPFTFAVRFSTGNQEYQYLGKEGSVEVGDLLLAFDSKHVKGGISIAQVTKVNTKSEAATKYFEGVKVKTEPLEH